MPAFRPFLLDSALGCMAGGMKAIRPAAFPKERAVALWVVIESIVENQDKARV